MGTFSGHQADVTQLLCLGERLLSLGNDHKVAVWKLNDYDSPEVHPMERSQYAWHQPANCACLDQNMATKYSTLLSCPLSVKAVCHCAVACHVGNSMKLMASRVFLVLLPQALLELGSSFEATCMAHPDTYLDKVIVGSADGRLQLWNFSSNSKLHEFQVGQGTAICCLVPSPALDVVGIGLADGCALPISICRIT